MNTWDILGITPTKDIKKIQYAYAEKLKKTKPTDNPEEFQKLHHAYNQAKAYAKKIQCYHLHSKDLPPVTTPAIQSSPSLMFANISSIPAAKQVDAQCDKQSSEAVIIIKEPACENPLIEEAKRLRQHIEEVLDNPRKHNDIKAWDFLSKSQYLLLGRFNWELGVWTFSKVAGIQNSINSPANRFSRKVNFNKAILSYLNSIFNWIQYEDDIRNVISSDLCNTLFKQLESLDSTVSPEKFIRGGSIIYTPDKTFNPYARNIKMWNYTCGVVAVLLIALFLSAVDHYLGTLKQTDIHLSEQNISHSVNNDRRPIKVIQNNIKKSDPRIEQ